MGDAYWAAREGDVLLHTSMLADLTGAAVELACCTAITVAVGLILLTGVGALLLLLCWGALLASDYIAEAVGEWVSGLFPPSEDGIIASGSHNTHTNSKPAARAAGIIKPQGTEDTDEQPTEFIDIPASILGVLWEATKQTAQQIVRPTIAAPDQPVIPTNDDQITCSKHPHPPGTYEYLAEGSSKVYINGQPAVRSNDRSTCEAKVTDNCKDGAKVSNNVRIGGEPIVVREIRSGKHPFGLALSLLTLLVSRKKLCAAIGCFMANIAIFTAARYASTKVLNAIEYVVDAIWRGNPVHLPTGAKLLFGAEDLDFTIPAHLPIEWQRF
ncbi:PAAR domain-containing protein, partial [Snodgrassella sp.]|uniref:PAAR domain-containing protein n=1 Tax=Snodgrassella sp. TaxID=2815304 RepID=UPI00258E623D